MTTTTSYRNLSPDECEAFARQRCTATDWNRVQVETEMDPWPDPDRGRFRDVHFVGQVQISRQAGFVAVDGIEKPAGIYGACLVNCRIGRDVRIANVAVHPDHRRKGIARELARRQEKWCRAGRFDAIFTETDPDNVAMITLNLAQGFMIGGSYLKRGVKPMTYLVKVLKQDQ